MLAAFRITRAQDRALRGRVTDRTTGQALPGVTVLVRGSAIGTSTSADGDYTLTVPASATTLTFSFIGYTTAERPITGAATIDVALGIATLV